MADFYTTGTLTATNNSTAITGSGTAFVTAGVRAGDILYIIETAGPVGYPIASVESATALTLATNYKGTSGSGKTFICHRRWDEEKAADTYRKVNEAADQLTDGTFIKTSGQDAAAKSSPVDNDLELLLDSEASYVLKNITYANRWAWIQSKLSAAGTAVADIATAIARASTHHGYLRSLPAGVHELITAADVVAHCHWRLTPDELIAIRKGEKARPYYRETLNTATRGARAEMPANMLVIAQANKVTIYDLESIDASTGKPPMWMVFNGASSWTLGNILASNGSTIPVSAVSAGNGCLYFGLLNSGSAGIVTCDFITDSAFARSSSAAYGGPYRGNIAQRNDGLGWTYSGAGSFGTPIINSRVNSIAVDVRPGTPRNAQRNNLPDATPVVGTDGGVSIIHPDGNVADITFTSNGNTRSVAFRPSDGALCIAVDSNTALTSSGRHRRVYHQLPTSDIAEGHGYVKGSADEFYPMYPNTAHTGTSFALGADATNYSRGFNGLYDVGYLQLVSFLPEPSKPESGARAVLTPTYNTGYMLGDIKLALAESTADVTSLVGSGELITNGTFATNDLTGWTIPTGTISGTYAVDASSGALNLQGTGSSGLVDRAFVYQAISTVAGSAYVVEFDVTDDSGGAVAFYAGTSSAGTSSDLLESSVNATGSYALTFIATGTTTYVGFKSTGTTNMTVDNVSIKRAVTDRSPANNGAIINGTVTRAAVATGAELAAYSGFSLTNYFENPYDADFDFGTGDFSIMGWASVLDAGSSKYVVARAAHDGANFTTPGWALRFDGSEALIFSISDVAFAAGDTDSVSSAAWPVGVWRQFCAVRRGSALELYVNGVRVATTSITNATGTLSGSAPLSVGNLAGLVTVPMQGSLALLRVSATAPTPEQIREIYEREKALFVENSDCLLPAANCSAMSLDPVTDLLHVATTSGMARVRGCEVVSKDATVVTGIAARDDYVATFDSNSADLTIPTALPVREKLLGHNGGPPLYDRSRVKKRAYTADATPKAIPLVLLREGEEVTFVLRSIAVQRADGAQVASYEHIGTARRVWGGSAALVGSVTERVIQEVTGTQACAVTASGNWLIVTDTGVASTNIEWTHSLELVTND